MRALQDLQTRAEVELLRHRHRCGLSSTVYAWIVDRMFRQVNSIMCACVLFLCQRGAEQAHACTRADMLSQQAVSTQVR